jgi:hypothetical protein
VKNIAALFMLLIPISVHSQEPASIYGYITDAKTGEVLISANVGLSDSYKGTSTNTSGYYSLTNISPGTYVVVSSYIGYGTFEKEITLESGESQRLDIILKPEAYRLEALFVKSTKSKEEINVGSAQLETLYNQNIPPVFEADVFRSLQLLPGVKAASDFSSGLYIRGGSPDQTLILLDGTPVYNPSHFFGFYSTFNPHAIKDVHLYKGTYPARFGGRLGSVLTVYNKEGNRNEFSGKLSMGMLASSATIENPFEYGSWMIAVRRSTLDPVLNMLNRSYEDIPEHFYFLDLNGKINFDINTNNKLTLGFYSAKDDLRFPFAEDAGIKLKYGNQIGSSKWTHIFSEKAFFTLNIFGSRYFNYPSFDIASTPFNRYNNIYDFSVKADVEFLPNDRHEMLFGLTSGIRTLKLRDHFSGNETFNSHIQARESSVYLQDNWKMSDQIIFSPGVRFTEFSRGNYFRIEPRIFLEYQPIEKFRLQAAFGKYNQFLTLISNQAFTGMDVWLTADEGVPPARGNQYMFGIKTIPWKGYKFDVELYYRSMYNLFEPDPLLPDKVGLPYRDIFRFGEGYAYGMEIFFDRRIGNLTGFIGYTYSVTRRKFPNFNKSLLQNSKAEFYPTSFDRSHEINIVLTFKLNARWSTSTVFNYATGQPYTKPLGKTITFESPLTDRIRHHIISGRINASRLPPYHRLDLGLVRKGSFLGMGDAELHLQVINVYSRRNIWFYRYDMGKNGQRDAVQLLPILPSISYSINF